MVLCDTRSSLRLPLVGHHHPYLGLHRRDLVDPGPHLEGNMMILLLVIWTLMLTIIVAGILFLEDGPGL